jgi:hypothetical protein
MIRTVELILGMHPLSLFDALARPMWEAFTDHPDLTPYTAITPTYPLDALNPASAARADPLGAALPFDDVDLVPQELSDQTLWRSVYGPNSTPPAPGPNASTAEQARADTARTTTDVTAVRVGCVGVVVVRMAVHYDSFRLTQAMRLYLSRMGIG